MGKNKSNTKAANPDKLKISEFLGWQARPISLGCVTLVLGYLSLYCTTVLGLNAGVVGILLMVSKIFDGITDLFAGYIIDNTHTKWGKARPYELCIIGVWVCTILLFACPPSFSTVLKYIWVFVMYSFVFSIFTTFLNISENPYIMRAFGTEEKITKVTSFGGIIITLGCMVVSVSFPMAMGALAKDASGWLKLVAAYAIPLLFIGLLRFVLVKEKDEYCHHDSVEKVQVKEIMMLLKKNKYVWFFGGMIGLNALLTGFNAYSYYYTYIVGDISIYSIIQMISMVSMVLLFIFPALMKRFSVVQLIVFFGSISIVGYIVNYFAGANVGMLGVGGILTGCVTLPLSYLQALIVMKLCSYNEMIGLPRLEASSGMISGFFTKIGNGVGLGLQGILLSIGGFVGSAAAQSAGTLQMIRCMYSFIPVVIAAGIILFAVLLMPLFKATKNVE